MQFEVFQYRMSNEYNAEVVMTPMGSKIARWINPEDLDERMSSSRNIWHGTVSINLCSYLKTNLRNAGLRINIQMLN